MYAALTPKVRKRTNWLVEELAEEEAGHFQLLTDRGARPDIADQISAEILTPASDRKISFAMLLPDPGEHPHEHTLLRYALGSGHTATEHYQSLAESTEPGSIHDLRFF